METPGNVLKCLGCRLSSRWVLYQVLKCFFFWVWLFSANLLLLGFVFLCSFQLITRLKPKAWLSGVWSSCHVSVLFKLISGLTDMRRVEWGRMGLVWCWFLSHVSDVEREIKLVVFSQDCAFNSVWGAACGADQSLWTDPNFLAAALLLGVFLFY